MFGCVPKNAQEYFSSVLACMEKNHNTKFKLARGCQGRVAVIGVVVVVELGGWVIKWEKERSGHWGCIEVMPNCQGGGANRGWAMVGLCESAFFS